MQVEVEVCIELCTTRRTSMFPSNRQQQLRTNHLPGCASTQSGNFQGPRSIIAHVPPYVEYTRIRIVASRHRLVRTEFNSEHKVLGSWRIVPSRRIVPSMPRDPMLVHSLEACAVTQFQPAN